MKKHFEVSKVALTYVFVYGSIADAIILYGWLILGRSDAPAMLIAVTGLMTACFGFYEWKARAENVSKNAKIYDVPVDNMPADTTEENGVQPLQ